MPAGGPVDLFWLAFFLYWDVSFLWNSRLGRKNMQYRYLGWDGAHFTGRVENWHLVGQMWPANMLCLPGNVFLSAWISWQHIKIEIFSLSHLYIVIKNYTKIFFWKVRISRNTGPSFPVAKLRSSRPHLLGHWSSPVCNVPLSFQAPIGIWVIGLYEALYYRMTRLNGGSPGLRWRIRSSGYHRRWI